MNSISLVVEGQADVILLRKLLGQLTDISFRYYAAGGQASLATVGRNILVHDGGPLMIAMDADTLNPSQADDSCKMVAATLRSVAPEDRFEVFAFVPELEIILFEAPSVLARRFAQEGVDRSLIEGGCLRPRETLRKALLALGLTEEAFYRELTSGDVEELRQGGQVAQFIAAVEGLTIGVGR